VGQVLVVKTLVKVRRRQRFALAGSIPNSDDEDNSAYSLSVTFLTFLMGENVNNCITEYFEYPSSA
jgi:hypothetical protein